MGNPACNRRLIPLNVVPKLAGLPSRRRGSRLHLRTVWRWATDGVSGVKLRTEFVGGQRCTTLEDLNAFHAAVAAARLAGRKPTPPARAEQRRPDVDAELDQLGL